MLLRCSYGIATVLLRCSPEVDQATCCGCITYGSDLVYYDLTMKLCVTCLSMPLPMNPVAT